MAQSHLRLIALGTGLGMLAACAVGPDYQRPPADTPPAYKEAQGWKPGEPQDTANRGAWWAVYKDPLLDELEGQIDVSNQNLKAFEAAYRQASAIIQEARAAYFPTLTVTGQGQRSGQGAGAGGSGSTSRGIFSTAARVQNSFHLTAAATWELDVWGRIRRTVESDVANAQASAADLASARLSAQGTLAADYFLLRVNDELKRLLDDTVDADQRALEITQNRYRSGVAAKSDVASAQAQVDGVRAQSINVGVQRAALEHAIAVLIGKPPAEFAIAPVSEQAVMPDIPPELPSALLERRPDIAGAERRMASANAQIGVAIAAYFPAITLSASYGYVSSVLDNLIRISNAVWAVGPQLAETVFDAGLRDAQVEAARAAYDQTVATYRQTVLTGFQQVEDELASLRILAQQAEVQDSAVRAAEEAEALILNQYKAGTVAYTSVITAQTIALGDEQAALTVMQDRLTASVALIQALGGGWSAAQVPDQAQVERDEPEKVTGSPSP